MVCVRHGDESMIGDPFVSSLQGSKFFFGTRLEGGLESCLLSLILALTLTRLRSSFLDTAAFTPKDL
jgi:hypothetical protein